jgi:nitrogen fixation-related uncharacterized protein
MRTSFMLWRLFIVLGALILSATPSVALAHDNIGGDELAAANWMLLGALVAILTGVLMGIWAWRSGQFSNIEESKYRMLENADDYDAIMAEADAWARMQEQKGVAPSPIPSPLAPSSDTGQTRAEVDTPNAASRPTDRPVHA